MSDTLNDTVTITGALTSTTLEAGSGDDSIVIQSNVSAGLMALMLEATLLISALIP